MKPADLIDRNWDRTFGCTELEAVAAAVVRLLAARGNCWHAAFAPEDLAYFWQSRLPLDWSLEHCRAWSWGTVTECDFLVDYCEAVGDGLYVVNAEFLKRAGA